jgi:hypothetical protein
MRLQLGQVRREALQASTARTRAACRPVLSLSLCLSLYLSISISINPFRRSVPLPPCSTSTARPSQRASPGQPVCTRTCPAVGEARLHLDRRRLHEDSLLYVLSTAQAAQGQAGLSRVTGLGTGLVSRPGFVSRPGLGLLLACCTRPDTSLVLGQPSAGPVWSSAGSVKSRPPSCRDGLQTVVEQSTAGRRRAVYSRPS